MKTPRPERCWVCDTRGICTWSMAPVRLLCGSCHTILVEGTA